MAEVPAFASATEETGRSIVRTKGRRPLTCHHEAGHALVRWFFGYATDRVTVLTVEQVRAGERVIDSRGRAIECEGLCEGHDIIGYPFGPLKIDGDPETEAKVNKLRAVARDVELINCLAGFYAEARHRRMSANACMFSGGLEDMRRFGTVLDAWGLPSEERRELEVLVEQRAAALVRSSKGTAAIEALADLLMERGAVDDEEIEAIFCRAYDGEKCRYGAWVEHWPPTLEQLRTGFIPEGPAKAAA